MLNSMLWCVEEGLRRPPQKKKLKKKYFPNGNHFPKVTVLRESADVEIMLVSKIFETFMVCRGGPA